MNNVMPIRPATPEVLLAKLAEAERVIGEVRSEMNRAAGWERGDGNHEFALSLAVAAGQVMAVEKLLHAVCIAVMFVKDGVR